MLRLLSLLQNGSRWTAPQLAEATESAPRTLRRDIEFLRDLGYPVHSSRGPGGYYQLVAGRALPPLMLEDDEAIATVLSLKLAANGATGGQDATDAAQRAESKIHRILPPRLRRTAEALSATTDVASSVDSLPQAGLVSVFAEAIAARRVLTFDYTKPADVSPRHVEPARLLRLQQRWYLFGWDRKRGDWRTFRLDRISDLSAEAGSFPSRNLPAADLPTYLREQFRGIPERTVTLVLHANVQAAADRLYRLDGALEPVDSNQCRYTAHVDSYEWLAMVLLLTDIEFTVESPKAFRSYLAEHAARLLRGSRL
ncbi:helix-turn-helix transcriptional regulator [Pseudoclavibacter sp. CFCC 13611]|uniref:helix-turn-helix transcriptional regulator n=1 Tax=Pseudoclavibacter sp. CFCC 13611 TaxID=2615178 RepID=UPI0013015229|nr:YafY family protein [Pseudoclavibacter sp. CFCC 13611]KAB1663598.1 YafY family transcriptional regulator [Pseudoclavibacter sp. CFCC 13611]